MGSQLYFDDGLAQLAMEDGGLCGAKLGEGPMSAPNQVERRLQPPPPPAPADTPLKCPRCDSLNTKFCYYNNYSQSQPRHFCKSCRRYWTKGGALRNVPVGGGCRRNKQPKQRSTEQTPASSHHHGRLLPQPTSIPTPPTPHAFYDLPNLANHLDLSSFPSTIQPPTSFCNSGVFADVASTQLPSFSSHLRSHGSFQHLRSEVGGLEVGGLSTFSEALSLQPAPSAAPSDAIRSRLAHRFSEMFPVANLALGLEGSHTMDGHALAGLQSEGQQPLEGSRQSMAVKAEKGSPSSSSFYGQTPAMFSFWNNSSTWSNLHPYNSSASPLL